MPFSPPITALNTQSLQTTLRFLSLFSFLLLNLLICYWQSATAQSDLSQEKQQNIDSLKQLITHPPHDTVKIKALYQLARKLNTHNIDTAITLSRLALNSAQKIRWQKGIGMSYQNLGRFYSRQDNYPSALSHYKKALSIYKKQDNKKKRAIIHGNIGIIYNNQGNYTQALEHHSMALALDKELANKRGIARHYSNLGIIHRHLGEHPKALENLSKGLEIGKKIDYPKLIAAIHSNMGIVYWKQGYYPKALDHYFKALEQNKKLDRKKGVAINLGNIGLVYWNQGNYSQALHYYSKALKLDSSLENKRGVARHLGNIGIIHHAKKNYSKALTYYSKALEIDKELGDKGGVARHFSNIGELYTEVYRKPDSTRRQILQQTFSTPTTENSRKAVNNQSTQLLLDTAITLQEKALNIRKKIGDKSGIAQSYIHLASILQLNKQYQAALTYYQKAYRLADNIGLLKTQKEAAKKLFEVYQTTAHPAKALKWYQRYRVYHDSLYNHKKQKEIIRLEARHKWKEKQLKDSLQHAKEMKEQRLRHTYKIQQQRYLLYSAGGGLMLVLIFAFILYNRFRVTRQQRDIIEQKNKEITDSIHYAKRIQDALLKEEEHVTPDLPPHFVMLKPQATVSGDFHWSVLKGDIWYTAVADCTGHGVPGGFLTMLGNAFLNELTAVSGHPQPNEILDQLRERFVKELGESEETEEGEMRLRDGMDISLLRVNLKTNEAQWAGANNPLYIIRNVTAIRQKAEKKSSQNENEQMASSSEVIQGPRHDGYQLWEFTPNPQPISYTQDPHPFTNHEFQLHKDDTLYLFSDGFPDQFGGPKGKKFMYKRFKQLLVDLQDQDMPSQKKQLEQTIHDWMAENDEEQIDDICILGVRV